MGALKELCRVRSDIKIIVTTATMDKKLFKDYFSIAKPL